MELLTQHIESLIFAAKQPISLADIHACLEAVAGTNFAVAELQTAIAQLRQRYTDDSFSFEIVEIGGGYQFLSKPAFHHSIGIHLKQNIKKRLSQAALETLSIVAYRQPVSKTELESIRGVSCDYAIQKLLERELVVIAGRAETAGRPLLYSTGEKFMDYFGISTLRDLPQPKDFKMPEDVIGTPAEINETAAIAPEKNNFLDN